MSLGRFLKSGKEPWDRLEQLVKKMQSRSGRRRRGDSEASVAELPSLFRRICQDLALAKHRQYSTKLVRQLNLLALSSHQLMYRQRVGPLAGLARFVAVGFPRRVRQEGWLMFWSGLLFFGSFLAVILAIQSHPELAWSILDAGQIESMEEMYNSAEGRVNVERLADSDVLMFGFYIRNNISIAFWIFAGGALFGLGSIFFLLFNGIFLGAIFGHLTRIGLGETLYPFVVGHGAFELTGIWLAGVAGLRLGMGLVSPGRNSRGQAFRKSAQQSVQLISGAGLMLLIAAFIEAFWSPQDLVSPEVKYWVGGLLWILVISYLTWAGRARRGS